MLKVEDINAGYDKLQILYNLSFQAKDHAITAVLGGNGCGKSTAMKTITGLIRPYSGSVVFNGRTLTGMKPQQIVQCGVAFVTQGKDIFPSMTVEENLRLGGYSLHSREKVKQSLEWVLEEIPHLKTKLHARAGVLSGGEQQMLSIGRGLMSRPKLLLLDEPSAALSPKTADEIYDLIVRVHRTGISILLVEQNVKKALEISDAIYVLSEGHVKVSGTAQDIRMHENIRAFYLGNTENS